VRRADDVGNLGEQHLAEGKCEACVAMADSKRPFLFSLLSDVAATVEVVDRVLE
jgi:hypothetical protein